MAPRQKRQKLTEGGADDTTAQAEEIEETTLDHSKSTTTKEKDSKQSTLFIRSLPSDATNDNLAEHFSQSFPIKHCVAVIDRATNQCKGYGFVTFADHEDARRALEELNGSDFKGNKIKIDFAERRHREDGDGPIEQPAKPAFGGKHGEEKEKEMQLGSKLIVRNLPWSVDTPEKLSRLFLSYGKINHVTVPKDTRGRMRGFGIVLLRGRKNAEHALNELNGKEIGGRTLAVDWAVDKDTWKKATEEEATQNGDEDASEASANADDAQQSEDEDDYEDVDEENDEDEEVGEGEEVSMDSNEPEPSESRRLTNNDATLFIRNVPFTCTEEDLQEHFADFGPVRYARLVLDPATERPRGTGFVCFQKKTDADTCLQEAPRSQAAPKEAKPKKDANTVGARSILENDLADPSGRYTIDGRVLQVTHAVDKSEASRLTAEGAASRNKRDRDKRRLYLLGEGSIPSNSPVYQTLSASEIAMREASAKQRKKLVDSNPSLNLSLTRLAIRNIPASISSKELKNLARDAIVGFATDVKEGKRQPLSKEELTRASEEMKEAERERKRKGKGVVKQAKIVFEGREGAKVQEGAGRSRGYGFIEYYTHRSALMGLRWLNGRSIAYQVKEQKGKGAKAASKEEMLDRKKRLIVEFAIENAQVVNRRKEIEIKSREKPKPFDAVKDEAVVKEVSKPTKGRKGSRKDEKPKDVKASTGESQAVKQRAIIARKKIASRAQKKRSK